MIGLSSFCGSFFYLVFVTITGEGRSQWDLHHGSLKSALLYLNHSRRPLVSVSGGSCGHASQKQNNSKDYLDHHHELLPSSFTADFQLSLLFQLLLRKKRTSCKVCEESNAFFFLSFSASRDCSSRVEQSCRKQRSRN